MGAPDIPTLESVLAHRFRRPELLQQALTHSSHAHEAQDSVSASSQPSLDSASSAAQLKAREDNELMEFLGDAVLGFVTSQTLFRRFPNLREGQLSKLRAHLVSARHLARVAQSIGLGGYLRLGRGEEKSGGRDKATLLVDALEAVLAALYLDGGLEPAEKFILDAIVGPELARLTQDDGEGFLETDYKSALQEWLQAAGRPQPDYVVAREAGPGHRKIFTVEVHLRQPNGGGPAGTVARADGSSKKRAEQLAARRALDFLRNAPAPAPARSHSPAEDENVK
jgi:ribonuclease-3